MIRIRTIEALPGSFVQPAPEDVHVWCVDLSGLQLSDQQLIETLSPEERHRMARLHFERDRYWFCMRRGLLRLLISKYLEVPPYDIKFAYGPHGKPRISPGAGTHSLRFNTTHSNGICLCAFSRNREVGVDLERIDRQFPYWQIAARFFTPCERAGLANLPSALRRAAFFRLWTFKEACVKADGRGLSLPLEHVGIPTNPDRPAVFTLPAGADATARQWSLHELSLRPGFAACLAVELSEAAV